MSDYGAYVSMHLASLAAAAAEIASSATDVKTQVRVSCWNYITDTVLVF